MAKIAIVTDSTACIPDEMLQGLQVSTIPLQLIWGEETLLDGIDITSQQFYERLKGAKIMPTTSQPSPAAFIQVYRDLLEKGFDILSIHISERLSGTIDSAQQARQALSEGNIEIFDARTSAMTQGFHVLLAARAARDGASLQECLAVAGAARDNSETIFAPMTLEYLHRGGRIGGAAAFLGTALGLKPILEVREGRVEPLEKIRTMAKAYERLVSIMEERIGDKRPIHIGALYSDNIADAEKLISMLKNRIGDNFEDTVYAPIGPVIGAHLGPGAVGLTLVAGV